MLFCAEIGSCHRGTPGLAYRMIREASLAGADMVKFQLGHWKPSSDHDGNYETQAMRRWPTDNAEQLKEWCDFWGVEFFASIFSHEGLDVARQIGQKRYKMASRKAFRSHSDEDYDDLFADMMKDGKEIFISDGQYMGYLIHKLLCVTDYPQYPPILMPEEFSEIGWYGYSSHVHGYSDALMAIDRGAKYIEKHVTLDPANREIKDNQFALTFAEFSEMTKIGREIEKYL